MELSQKITTDDSPVARLYKQHGPALFAYLCTQTDSPETAEDVLVEVFITALETNKLDQLNEREQLAWLWRIARNKGVDAYRRSRVRRGLDLSQIVDLIDSNERSPELVILQQEASVLLHTYLDRLSPIQQKAVYLRFAHGLRTSEIATVMGKRQGAVRSLLARALNYLRTLYAKEQGETSL